MNRPIKRFAILRDVPPDFSWEQMDASAIENMMYMGIEDEYRDIAWEKRILGVNWVRTYWEPGSTWGVCLYTAPDVATVEQWHDLCHVPYAGIREVDVEEDESIDDGYPRGFHAIAEDAPLIAIETSAEADVQAAKAAGYRWIRTYRDPKTSDEVSLFLPPEAARHDAPLLRGVLHRVVELRPEDYD